MAFVLAAPEALMTAASDLAGIGSNLTTANAAAVLPTASIVAAGADEVSAKIAALFSSHARGYQQLSAQAAGFHEQFVLALNSNASAYATTETNAARTLANALSKPAETLLGHPLIGNSGTLTNALGRAQSIFGDAAASTIGGRAVAAANALSLTPTGGVTSGLSAASALLQPVTNAAAAPAAFAAGSIGDAIKNFYNTVEPWVRYGFQLATWAVGWLPWIGLLAPQIMFFYDLIEPLVQSGLFNTIDVLNGTITFGQGLSNFWDTTTASINQFINTEINWIRSFFPPLPPLPAAA